MSLTMRVTDKTPASSVPSWLDGFLAANVARGTFYAGVIMVLAALWDLIRPASRRCSPHGSEASITNG